MQEKILSLQNTQVHYYITRKNATKWVIFLHGAGVDHHMFDKQLKSVPDEYSILAVDIRCHGKSQCNIPFSFAAAVDDILAIYKNEGISQAILVGQSMGGNIAQAIAMSNPTKVSGLVIIDSTRNAQNLTALEKLYIRLTPTLLAFYPKKSLINASAKACGVKESTQDYVKKCFESMPIESFISVMSSLLTCVQPNPKYQEHCPMLLICGDKDKSGNIIKSMKQWPSQTVNIISNAGHNSNQDQPEIVNKLITQFLLNL